MTYGSHRGELTDGTCLWSYLQSCAVSPQLNPAHIAQAYPPSSDCKPTLQWHHSSLQSWSPSSPSVYLADSTLLCQTSPTSRSIHSPARASPSPEKWQRNAGSCWNVNKTQWRKRGVKAALPVPEPPLCVSLSRTEAAVTQCNCCCCSPAASFTHFLNSTYINMMCMFQAQSKKLNFVFL